MATGKTFSQAFADSASDLAKEIATSGLSTTQMGIIGAGAFAGALVSNNAQNNGILNTAFNATGGASLAIAGMILDRVKVK